MTPEELLKKQKEEATEKGEVKAPPKQIIVDMRGPQVTISPAAFVACMCVCVSFVSGFTLPRCGSVTRDYGGVVYAWSRLASCGKLRVGALESNIIIPKTTTVLSAPPPPN